MDNVSISSIQPLYDKMISDQIAPVFEGLGTHYSFIWVGTPPQRVSVILDTGSHHTAFPCVGCNCGKHMDALFDHTQSSTAELKTCGGEITYDTAAATTITSTTTSTTTTTFSTDIYNTD